MIKRIRETLDRASGNIITSNPLSIALMLFALVVIYAANSFPEGGVVGPGFFPIMISVGIIVFAVVDLFNETETELELSDQNFGPAIIVLGLLAGYVLVMPYTGFLVGSMLFLPAVLYYSEIRSKTVIAALSIGMPILLFYIFSRIFFVRLPEGIIPFSRLLPQLPLMVTI